MIVCGHECENWNCGYHPACMPTDGTLAEIRDMSETEECLEVKEKGTEED